MATIAGTSNASGRFASTGLTEWFRESAANLRDSPAIGHARACLRRSRSDHGRDRLGLDRGQAIPRHCEEAGRALRSRASADEATQAAWANAGLGCFVGVRAVPRALPPPRNDAGGARRREMALLSAYGHKVCHDTRLSASAR